MLFPQTSDFSQGWLIFFDDLNAKQIVVTPKVVPNLYLILLQRIIQNLVGNWLKNAANSAVISLDKADEQRLNWSSAITPPKT